MRQGPASGGFGLPQFIGLTFNLHTGSDSKHRRPRDFCNEECLRDFLVRDLGIPNLTTKITISGT